MLRPCPHRLTDLGVNREATPQGAKASSRQHRQLDCFVFRIAEAPQDVSCPIG